MISTPQFAAFQSVVIIPFVAGALLKNRFNDPVKLTRRLVMINLVIIEPPIVFWSIWGLKITAELIYLPVAGFCMVLFGLAAGRLFGHVIRLDNKSKTTFIISSSIANHGFTMGGFICYLFMGEKGLGLSFIFLSYFIPYLFLVIFPYAKQASKGESYSLDTVKEFIKSPRNMPLYAMIVAIFMRLYGITRPMIIFPVEILLMLSIGVYYFSLGLSFLIGDVLFYKKESLTLCMIRFLLIPAMTVIVLVFLNLDPDIESVILIESFMPAAVYSVMSSVLFGLDERRASAMFVFNTVAFLLFVLPMMLIFIKDLRRIIS
ncbi:MAG TPA: AEC family transporter [Desulfomonilia bacterium]